MVTYYKNINYINNININICNINSILIIYYFIKLKNGLPYVGDYKEVKKKYFSHQFKFISIK